MLLILFGVLITGSNNLLSYAYHAYQAELFPTRVRARAVGFVYSFSRLSTIFTSFIIAFFLQNFGAGGVFGFICAAMLVVVIAIGGFGPRTRGWRWRRSRTDHRGPGHGGCSAMPGSSYCCGANSGDPPPAYFSQISLLAPE